MRIAISPGKMLLFHQSPALIIITKRNIYIQRETYIYKEKRAKNKKGIISLAGMRLSKGGNFAK